MEEVHVGLDDLPGVLPAAMKVLAALMGETALGLSDLAVVERQARWLMPAGSRGGAGPCRTSRITGRESRR